MIKSKHIKGIQGLLGSKGTLKITEEQWFMLSAMIVNVGNYLYNLIIGRMLGPVGFADASLLVTMLLVLSFLAMTFQLTAAKFTAEMDEAKSHSLLKSMNRFGLIIGMVIMLGVSTFARSLQQFFQSETMWMYVIFAMSVPLYFLMSIGRGYVQGSRSFTKLSMSYQLEMLIRLCGTVALLRLLNVEPGISISLGILASIALGSLPIRKRTNDRAMESFSLTKTLWVFAAYTLMYELSQVLINNTDILLVKHYFSAEEAGLYAALAMIGRVVFFIAWMFAMILLPHVIAAEKAGKDSRTLLWKYVSYTSVLGAIITGASYLIPEVIVHILFGSAYTEIAPLLWLYALATSLFAVANMFAYYFLSRSMYRPIYLTFIVGLLQVIGLIAFHASLYQVVILQVVLMAILLMVQVAHYIHYSKSVIKRRYIGTVLSLTETELPLTEDKL